jgi:aconitate hydratase
MLNSFNSQQEISIGGKSYHFASLPAAQKAGLKDIDKLPISLKVLLENLLRNEDDSTVTKTDIQAFAEWVTTQHSSTEIAYRPARVLMQDFTGVPAVVDLAAMRDAMKEMHGSPSQINPLCPVDLVIDHSVQVDQFGSATSLENNTEIEMKRNHERYSFLKWGQDAFSNFQAVPPGTGICHQVNLEYIAQCVWEKEQNGKIYLVPDTLVGTDSHTTMINGLGVLGWGVGGIEAEAAMLGQSVSMLIPDVIGFKLEGKLKPGVTATDLVLTITEMLRKKGVVGKFVEFYGPGLQTLPLADRATIANMAPEYGATCGFFPIDEKTVDYLKLSGRPADVIERVIAYSKAQGMWHDENTPEPVFTDTDSLNLSAVVPSLAGPKRPQDRVTLSGIVNATNKFITSTGREAQLESSFAGPNDTNMYHGDIVIAAITSCTNTSNPSVMLAAGLLAKKAVEMGLKRQPWVKASLAPGSKVVTDYLKKTGLLPYLEKLGFYLVGYGCTTCIGNSGPLPEDITATIKEHDVIACGVLSGNRNFEGRIHPLVKANWLASPPLVVAFALAGTTRTDLMTDALGVDQKGNPVMLRDIWPSNDEVAEAVMQVNRDMFSREYAEVFAGDKDWQAINVKASNTFDWDKSSTYVKKPPFFENMSATPEEPENVMGARMLALLGDSVTTDHISPAGAIKAESPAGLYLMSHGVDMKDFNSYGSRRGNHEVMMRGTFANIRIRNEMTPTIEGGFTKLQPAGEDMPIYDAAMQYANDSTPLVVVAGKEYGTGSSRDWAAKGTALLGVKAVIAESFERIHRSNLIGVGVLPLEFQSGDNRKTLKLTGEETFDIMGIAELKPGCTVSLMVHHTNGREEHVKLLCRIDTGNELEYYRHGGILQYVLRNRLK